MALPSVIENQGRDADALQAAFIASMQNAPEDPRPVVDTVEPPQAQPAPAAPAPSPPAEDFQQKFRTLQGIHAKRMGELQAERHMLESKLAQLTEQFNAFKQQQVAKPKEPEKLADPKDVQEFGADMVEMVQRQAQRAFTSLAAQFVDDFATLKAELEAIKSQLTGVGQRTEVSLEQQFYSTLAALVPDWETVNAREDWLEWLGEEDPIYGASRQEALDVARKRHDAQRAANVFKAFKATLVQTKPETLENKILPEVVSSAGPAAKPAQQAISSAFVEKFYNDVAKGRYVGREDLAASIETDIQRAAAAGMIR